MTNGTILELFQEQARAVDPRLTRLVARGMEKKRDDDEVILESVPENLRALLALCMDYKRRASLALHEGSFNPDADLNALHLEIVECEEKAELLSRIWWTSINELTGHWCNCQGEVVEIREGWVVVKPHANPVGAIDGLFSALTGLRSRLGKRRKGEGMETIRVEDKAAAG